MTTKVLIFDASAIITLFLSDLSYILKELKKIFPGKFIITKEVEIEVVKSPMQIKRFQLEALKVQELLIEKILEYPSSLGISDKEIKTQTSKVLEITNSTYFSNSESMKIIHSGEASCIALSYILNKKKIDNALVIDERTTRMIAENPENLRRLFERKLHSQVRAKKENYDFCKDIKIIRSTELIMIALKRGIIKLPGASERKIAALLYAAKYKGCSISFEEIDIAKNFSI